MGKIKIQLIRVSEVIKIYWSKIPEQFRKILGITGIIFASLVVLMFILSLLISTRKSIRVVRKTTPVPFPQSTSFSEIIVNPSRYATDSGILKIEGDLKVIEEDLDNLQINEVNLLPPRLDFDVNFEE